MKEHRKVQESVAPTENAAIPNSDLDWLQRLEDSCWKFDFFDAVRKLDVHFAREGKPRIGHALKYKEEDPIHFGQRPFDIFGPRQIDQWLPHPPLDCDFQKPALLVFFFGFFGPDGPLPSHINEEASRRSARGDFVLTNFANIFHHRMLSFYYRAWASTRMTVDMDRLVTESNSHSGSERRFPRFIASLLGQAHWFKRPGAGETEYWPGLFFAGHLAARTRHAEGLEALLSEYFGIPVCLEQAFGRWMTLPKGLESRVGSLSEGSQLGRATVLGENIWDTQGSIRLRLGPLTLEQFRRLLPYSRGGARLVRWVSEYCGPALKWDAQLILRKDEIPETRLDGNGCLGMGVFLKSRAAENDADGIIFDLALSARNKSASQSFNS